MSQERITVAVFSKPPSPGEVKTRLVPLLGAHGAARLARAFLLDAVALVRSIPWAHLVVATTGSFPSSLLDNELQGIPIWDQGPGNLGDRLEHILLRALEGGGRAAIALGADSPGLSAAALEEAFVALERERAVLGPSHDGGYYLIGLRVCSPGMLSDIPWSTADTFEATRARLLSSGVSVGTIEPCYDIDTPEDLLRLEAMLRAGEVRAPATARALRELGRL